MSKEVCKEIIELVASWLQPGIDTRKLKESPFYDVILEWIEELIDDWEK